MADFDFSELDALAADLGKVAGNAGPLINSAVQVTAGKIKAAARESVKASGGFWQALPPAIDYDVKGAATVLGSLIQAEIGYKVGGAGSLGGIRELGAPNAPDVIIRRGKNGELDVIPIPGTHMPRPPHNDLANALHANEDDFERGLLMATEQAEREAGL